MNRALHHPVRQAGRRLIRWETLESRLALSSSLDPGFFTLGPVFDPTGGGADFSTFDLGALGSLGAGSFTPNPINDPSGGGADFATFDPGPVLSVAASDPAPGARLIASPTTLAVKFDQPVAFWTIGRNDLLIDRVNTDGTTTPVIDPDGVYDETLDPTGQWLSIALGQPLGPGHYRLSLSDESGLTGVDGSPLAVGGQTVAEFTILSPGVKLSDAEDLGTPDATPTATAGVLDLAADPASVRLYKITLPAGHHWRLGLEVSAQRDGGTLDAALALFDSLGRPIATDDMGRSDAPADPYLFAGLEPGVYYIGVSGRGNLPGQPGGYDPVTGDAGQTGSDQSGGPFRLHVVADPADAPISLTQLIVDRADPLNPTPTGLTLQFSGVLGLDLSSNVLDQLTNGVELVDQAGRVWPLAASGYNDVEARYSYLLLGPLPAGSYTLRLPDQGGLTDLAGASPVAADVFGPRLPRRVLATFSVDATALDPDPLDLGPLFPNTVQAGVSTETDLAAGASADVRFVVIHADYYELELSHSGGPISARLICENIDQALDADVDRKLPPSMIYLAPGVYHVQIKATGEQGAHVLLTHYADSSHWEALLANGVGQGPALGLRLIAPVVPDLTTSPPPVFTPPPVLGTIPPPPPSESRPPPSLTAPTPQTPGVDPTKTANPAPGPSTTTPGEVRIESETIAAVPTPRAASLAANAGFASAQGPAGLYLAPGGQPVGRPAPNPEANPAFSPRLDSAEAALAMGQSGLPGRSALGVGDLGLIAEAPAVAFDHPAHNGSGFLDDASNPGDDGDLTQTDPIQDAATLDPFAWLAQLRTNLLAWNMTPFSVPAEADAAETVDDPRTADLVDTKEEPTNLASLSPSQGVGLTVLVTIGYHRLFSRRALRGRRLKHHRAAVLLGRQS
ncbi:MAG: PPC domain-containing protein [Isosphaeraceae bacterium]